LQYQLAPELNTLERLAYATVRKALASEALAAASGTRARSRGKIWNRPRNVVRSTQGVLWSRELRAKSGELEGRQPATAGELR
jgi:hypothetical protein